MKKIPLSQGKFALVDDADFEWLNQWKWSYQNGYARRNEYLGGGRERPKRKSIAMHRLIMATPDGMFTDHIDMDTLNNQRINLRNATSSENGMNRKSYKGSSSAFKGVYWHGQSGKWAAQIVVNKKPVSLGTFDKETDAANAYDLAAKKAFGQFARLNG